MDPYDSSLDKEYEQLNEAIMKAIVSSPDVKKVLQEFQSKDLINHLSVLNLILSLEELSELVFSGDDLYKLEPLEERSAPPKAAPAEGRQGRKGSAKNLVDGKSLSPNEILFERFYQGKFDERRWLKKTRIKL